MVAPDTTDDSTINWWARTYILVPIVASSAAVGLARIDPTRVSLGPVRYSGVVGYAGLLGFVYHTLVVGIEEPKLEAAFGDAYRSYCDQVPRWLPRRPD